MGPCACDSMIFDDVRHVLTSLSLSVPDVGATDATFVPFGTGATGRAKRARLLPDGCLLRRSGGPAWNRVDGRPMDSAGAGAG